MIKVPIELKLFAELTGQTTDGIKDEAVRVRIIYQLIMSHELTELTDLKAVTLERGRIIVAFLGQVLAGPYSNDELAIMWLRDAQAETYFPARSIRNYLDYIRAEIDALNRHVENGTFVPVDRLGRPQPPLKAFNP